jgi:GrpB-like predicted nucleotidyltransferase (UPF0157 family)
MRQSLSVPRELCGVRTYFADDLAESGLTLRADMDRHREWRTIPYDHRMRIPPLPTLASPFTPEKMAARAVGNRSTQVTSPIVVHDYDPTWPLTYAVEEARIRAALGSAAFAIVHVGSTAVPGLAAKNRLDIDLIVADPADEDAYVPALEPAGYFLRARDVDWYQHRCLWTLHHGVNLHVFGPDCDEHIRHVVFRDWLRTHPGDRDRYADAKRQVAAAHPMDASAYIAGKSTVIIEILVKAGLRAASAI